MAFRSRGKRVGGRSARSSRGRRAGASRSPLRRPELRPRRFEPLEERALLAVFNLTAGVTDGQSGSLRAAISAANSNSQDDEIILGSGTFTLSVTGAGENNNATGDLDLKESGREIVIRGAGAGVTFIDANGIDRAFHVHSGVIARFEDLTILNGAPTGSGNTGGGLRNDGGVVELVRVEVTSNSAYQGGGIYSDGGELTIEDSLIADNTSTRHGGGVYVTGGDLTIVDSEISENTATSLHGGGIYATSSTITIAGSQIKDNTATGTTGNGGGAALIGQISISDSVISGNQSVTNGAGLYISTSSVMAEIVDSTISGNQTSNGPGGGVYTTNTGPGLKILRTTISGNSTSGGSSSANGGGVNASMTLQLLDSTVSGNTAAGYGGGVSYSGATSRSLTIENSTLSGNTASGAYGGGLIFAGSSGSPGSTLNATIYNNSAGSQGGGVYVSTTVSLAAKNTIFAGNSASTGPDIRNSLNSQGYNLIQNTSGASISGVTTGNITGSSPQLGALANNGGPTLTHMPGESSPVIDAGTSSGAPAADQRGLSRPQGSGYDIGAVEYGDLIEPPTAVADSYSTYEDTLLSVTAAGVLSNDSGASIEAIPWSGSSTRGAAVALAADGSFTYDPREVAVLQALAVGQSLTDTFTYTIENSESDTDTATVTITVHGLNDAPTGVDDARGAAVLGRWVFYNNSTYDGDDAALGQADDAAIALDKRALLPGQTATFAHYTSYSRGLNGVMVDLADAPGVGSLSASDFTFRVGNDSDPGSWSAAPTPAAIAVRTGDGVAGSARVSIRWADGAIVGQWLQVIVKANANTGLLADDVFYFGNAPGETGDNPAHAEVTAADAALVLTSLRHPFPIADRYDFNRDGVVDEDDEEIAENGETNSSTALQLITAPSGGPSSLLTVRQNATLTWSAPGVLANDTDIDDGDTLVAHADSGGETGQGVFTISADGQLQYDPTAATAWLALKVGQAATDSFVYTLEDDHEATDTATVTVTVLGVNHAPVGVPDEYETHEDAPVGGNVLTNDSDPNGDLLKVFAFTASTSLYNALVTMQSDGSFVYDPTGAACLNALAVGQSVTDSFSYTVTDGKGGETTVTVDVIVTGRNDAPVVIAAPSPIEVDEDAADTLLDLTTVFADPDDGDTLTFSVVANDNGALVTPSIDGDTLTLAYAADQYGEATVRIRATDPHDGYVEADFEITVSPVNDAPRLSRPLYDLLVVENAPRTFLDVTRHFVDPEGDPITYTVVDNDNPTLVAATIVNDRLRLTYTADETGVAVITIRAADGAESYVEEEWQVTVGDDPPAESLGGGEGEARWQGDVHGDVVGYGGWAAWAEGDGDGGAPDTLLAEGMGQGEGEFAASFVPVQLFHLLFANAQPCEDCNLSIDGGLFSIDQKTGEASTQVDPVRGPRRGPGSMSSGGSAAVLNLVASDPVAAPDPSVVKAYAEHEAAAPSTGIVLKSGLSYNSADNPHPILAFDYILSPTGGGSPDVLQVEFTFWPNDAGDPVTAGPVYYNVTGVTVNDEPLRIGMQIDATELPSGFYDFTIDVTEYRREQNGDQIDFVVRNEYSHDGVYVLHNRAQSEFGNRWWLEELDQLHIRSGGVGWLQGNSTGVWFELDGGQYVSEEGNFSHLTHDSETGWYTITHHHGGWLEFDANGLLRRRGDTHGAATTYAYYDVLADGGRQVAFITDPFGRATAFHYEPEGLLVSTVDFAGRESTWSYTQDQEGRWLVTSITHPDPDGAGPLEAPVTQYAYTDGRLTSITDPLGRVSTVAYDDFGLVSGGVNPAAGAWSLAPQALGGLVLPSVATSQEEPADSILSEYVEALYVGVNGVEYTANFDRFGQPTDYSDGAGGAFVRERDEHGRMTALIAPDPDGEGPLGALRTEYTWGSCCGNLLEILYPDSTSESWTYGVFNRLESHTDPLGRVTRYDLDEETGAVLAVRRIVGAEDDEINEEEDDVVYSFTYTSTGGALPGGLLLTVTDPLGRVTSYAYEDDPDAPDFGWLTTVTYAVGLAEEAAVHYEHDLAGNITAIVNELGLRTEFLYDAYDRLIQLTAADPDDEGPLEAPVTSYRYDAAGQLIERVDPLGNSTEFEYDDLGRLVRLLAPSPDGGDRPITEYLYDDVENLLTVVDPLGRESVVEFDAAGRPHKVWAADPDGEGGVENFPTEYVYGPGGVLLAVIDPLGRETRYEYDERLRVVLVTLPDPDGEGPLPSPTLAYTYYADGQVESVTRPGGRVTAYTYDDLGRLVSVTLPDPDGAATEHEAPVTTFEYDPLGALLRVTDPRQNVTEYAYDARQRLVLVTLPDPDGPGGPLASPTIAYAYDAAGRLTSVVDPLGRVTAYEYDDLGRPILVTLPDPDGPGDPLASPEIAYEYDLAGNLVRVIDPRGGVTEYEYDDLYRRIKTILPDPDGEGALLSPVVEYAYDLAGRLTSVVDPLERVTTYEYDDLDRLILVTLPDPDGPIDPLESPEIAYEYDLLGNLLSTTDPLGNVTQYEYDALGRVTEIRQPIPDGPSGSQPRPTILLAYDDEGRLHQRTDPRGHTTTYGYDALDRLVSVTAPDPDGEATEYEAPVTRYEYDEVGNLRFVIDPREQATEYQYDELYRRVAVIDANLAATTFTYDAAGNLLSLTDPVENTTVWDYDALNRVVAETITLDSQPVSRTFAYDAAGNLIERIDRNGRAIEWEYDFLQRRVAERWLDDMTTIRTIEFSYDAAGQLLSASDPAATYTYVYDNLGRTMSIAHDITGLTPEIVFTQAFDAAGNRTQLAATIGSNDDFVNDFLYDGLNRLVRVTQQGQSGGNAVAEKRVDLAYNPASQFAEIARYADAAGADLVAATTFTYDDMGRLLSLVHAQDTTTLAGYEYFYDDASRLIAIDSVLDGLLEYGYDDRGQLTAADYASHTDEAFSYDDNGNRTLTGYDTGDHNRLLSDGVYDYQYDAEGNRVRRVHISSGATTVYNWDHRNRLVSVIDYADATDADEDEDRLHVVEHQYDLFNRWIGRTVDPDGDTGSAPVEQTFFIYDGVQIVLQFDGDAASDLSHRYLWGPAVDQIFADEAVSSLASAGDILWPLTDHLGTTRDLAEYNAGTSTTTVVSHRFFDSFGVLVYESNASFTILFGFTARPFDSATGLQNNWHRWYDATIGRWLSEDPIGFGGGDVNLLRYVSNSPQLYSDANGLRGTFLGDYWFYLTHQYRAIITGDYEASDEVYENSVNAMGEYYLDNAADTHRTLNAISKADPTGLGMLTEGVLQAVEGEELHNAVMDRGRLRPERPGHPVVRPPAENFGQELTEVIHDCGPMILRAAALAEQLAPCNNLIVVCFVAGTPVVTGIGDESSGSELVAFADSRYFTWLTIIVTVGAIVVPARRRLLARAMPRRKISLPQSLEHTLSMSYSMSRLPPGGLPEVEVDTYFALPHCRDISSFEQRTVDPFVTSAPAAHDADGEGESESTTDNYSVEMDSAHSISESIADAARQRHQRGAGVVRALPLAACCVFWALLVSVLSFGLLGWQAPQYEPTAGRPTPATLPIEEVRVGQRVYVAGVHDSATDVDPATWRLLRLEAKVASDNGIVDHIFVETLQAPEWISYYGAEVGAIVPLPLDVHEMGLPTSLRAKVVANRPCPSIQGGVGRVVTTTVNHLNNRIMALSVASSAKAETIYVTAFHKFYCPERDSWVSAQDLVAGDRLASLGHDVNVVSLQPLSGIHRVYNFTVERDHVYRVSTLGVLVHNNDCDPPIDVVAHPDLQPPHFPGFDPGQAPGPDWQWRGQQPPGNPHGGWFNPDTGETLHPDLGHGPPIGAHWDWRDPNRDFWRIFPDGAILPRR